MLFFFALIILSAPLVDCSLPGRRSPAATVPLCVDAQGFSVSCSTDGRIVLWPDNLQPASQIPRSRDSTDRKAGNTIPGERTGHQLFSDVAIVEVDGEPELLVVSYNAGLQVWDIRGDRGRVPVRLAHADGWDGDFIFFPAPDEVLSFCFGVDALNVGDGQFVVALACRQPVGPSLWFYDFTLGLQQLYQDAATGAKQIRIDRAVDGTVYALAGAENGLTVYNVTAALDVIDDGPCGDQQGQACPGVFIGFVSDTTTTTQGETRIFIDTLQAAGSIFVAASGGLFTPLELWQVNLVDPARSVLRFSGLPHSLGSALFEYGGHFYWSVVTEEDGLNLEKLRVFMIDGCIASAELCFLGTGSIEDAVVPINLPRFPTAEDFLTVSKAHGRPYIYYGVGTGNLSGGDLEQLFDAGSLRSPNGAPLTGLPEVTASGGSYTDPCNGAKIRYWSHYYHSNAQGLNNLTPRNGVMSSIGYFYRALGSVLDVHRRKNPNPGAIFSDGFETGDTLEWMGMVHDHNLF